MDSYSDEESSQETDHLNPTLKFSDMPDDLKSRFVDWLTFELSNTKNLESVNIELDETFPGVMSNIRDLPIELKTRLIRELPGQFGYNISKEIQRQSITRGIHEECALPPTLQEINKLILSNTDTFVIFNTALGIVARILHPDLEIYFHIVVKPNTVKFLRGTRPRKQRIITQEGKRPLKYDLDILTTLSVREERKRCYEYDPKFALKLTVADYNKRFSNLLQVPSKSDHEKFRDYLQVLINLQMLEEEYLSMESQLVFKRHAEFAVGEYPRNDAVSHINSELEILLPLLAEAVSNLTGAHVDENHLYRLILEF